MKLFKPNEQNPDIKIPVYEVFHEVIEYHGVHVLAELHQDEPVTEPKLLQQNDLIASFDG